MVSNKINPASVGMQNRHKTNVLFKMWFGLLKPGCFSSHVGL